MGYYINQDSKGNSLPHQKVKALIADGAQVTDATYKDNLVCVVSNGGVFDAAGYVYSQQEFDAFTDPYDTRHKIWLVYEHAKMTSGYEK